MTAIPAADLLAELDRLGVVGENLAEHRVLGVAALDDVLGVPVELPQGGGELVVVRAEQLADHRVVACQHRAEAQREHGHAGGGPVEQFLVGEQVLGPAERAVQVHVADQRREVVVADGPDLARRVADALCPGFDLDVARQDPVHVDARMAVPRLPVLQLRGHVSLPPAPWSRRYPAIRHENDYRKIRSPNGTAIAVTSAMGWQMQLHCRHVCAGETCLNFPRHFQVSFGYTFPR